jgi:hypothetical protein
MELLYFILIVLGISLAALSIQAWSDHVEEKEEKEKNIKRLQQDIKREYESIEHAANVFGDEYAAKLTEFADKMDKITSNDDIKRDLKPYDMMGRENLCKTKRKWGMIIIDKNLSPKFVATYLTSGSDIGKDVELGAALDSKGVRELAEKCRKAKLDYDIEKYRKKKIENFIKD